MAIPNFDHNLVIPPHMGNPVQQNDLSPYKCTSIEFCQHFSTSPERIEIMKNFLAFRQRLHNLNMTQGFQWLDGSFLENVEVREQRSPNDLDLVTVYWGYDIQFQTNIYHQFPEFANSTLSKQIYSLDHYPFDAGYAPDFTVEFSRYWIQLFSHNRDAVWKGMLQIPLNTPMDDNMALHYLNSI